MVRALERVKRSREVGRNVGDGQREDREDKEKGGDGEHGEKEREEAVHFYCSSGGNAGVAAVVAAAELGCPATIVVPLTISPLLIAKLRTLGAHVIQNGTTWSAADAHLLTTVLASNPTGIYVPPFDHPDIWNGCASMIDELSTQLPSFDAICCSVGGAGLLCGIMEGLSRNNKLETVKVLATETVGADSFYQSVQAGHKVTLAGITSIATSLGATYVCEKALEWAKLETVKSITVTDAQAAIASVRFADDERIIIEVACGAAVAPIYNGELKDSLAPEMSSEEWSRFKVVIVVCGGNNVTLDLLRGYRERYAEEVEGELMDQVGGIDSSASEIGGSVMRELRVLPDGMKGCGAPSVLTPLKIGIGRI